MKLRDFLVISTGMKIMMLTVVILSVVVTRYSVSSNGKIWFSQIANERQVEEALKNDPLNVDIINDVKEGITGLMLSAKVGRPDLAKLFIQFKADLNMQAKNEDKKDDERAYKNTALHYAVLNSNDDRSFEVAKLLIKSGADVTAKNGKGYTPLHLIYGINNNIPRRMELMKLLVEAAGNKLGQIAYINAQNNEGSTMLFLAAQMNELKWVAALIKEFGKEVKFDIPNYDKRTNPKGMLPEDIAATLGFGGVMAKRLKKAHEKYDKLSDEEFKKLDFMKLDY